MSDLVGAHGDSGWRERELARVTGPIDTIREALEGGWRPVREDGTYAHSPRYENALAALTEVEHQLADNRIPHEGDEKPSDAMPSAGHKDWRETAEWWQTTCEYWNARSVAAETALAEALAQADDWPALAAKRDEWRERAEAAERRVEALTIALRDLVSHGSHLNAEQRASLARAQEELNKG